MAHGEEEKLLPCPADAAAEAAGSSTTEPSARRLRTRTECMDRAGRALAVSCLALSALGLVNVLVRPHLPRLLAPVALSVQPDGQQPAPDVAIAGGANLFNLAAEAIRPVAWKPSVLSEEEKPSPRHSCTKDQCHQRFQKGHSCQCNIGCEKFRDCCPDYHSVCHAEHEGSSHHEEHRPTPLPRCRTEAPKKGECKHPRILAHPGASAPLTCMCPPPLVPHKNRTCNDCLMPKKAQRMTFYMYRAMGPDVYQMQNVNMASLGGVLWYLHREVVASTPRKFHIDRIARYSVTLKVTEDYFKHTPNQFGPFVAFDFGSAKGRSHVWEKYGFVVGCQLVDPNLYNYVPRPEEQPSCHPLSAFPCRAPKWYSLPGPCPEEKEKQKSPACAKKWPGGMCPSPMVTGSHTCTYFAAPAGEIMLDELENITDYKKFWIGTNETTGAQTPNGNIEYDPKLDAGVGMSFWDGRHDKKNCTRRMEAVERLFKEKYPELPSTLPEPPCN